MPLLHELVSSSGRESMMKILLERGANVNVKMKKCGHTPFYVAYHRGNEINQEMIDLLVQYGATDDGLDAKGKLYLISIQRRLFSLYSLYKSQTYQTIQSEISKMPDFELVSNLKEGKIPLGGWFPLLQSISSAKQKFEQNNQEILALNNSIEQAEQHLLELKTQLYHLTNSQVSLNQLTDLDETVFRRVANIANTIRTDFQKRVSHPEWNLQQMTASDFSIVLSNYKLAHLIPSFLDAGIDRLDSFLVLDYAFFQEFSSSDLHQLLFCQKMIENGRFWPGEHELSCSICSSDIQDLMGEYDFPLQAIQKVAGGKFSIGQLLFFQYSDWLKTFSLPPDVALQASQAVKSILQIHTWDAPVIDLTD